MIVSIHLLYLKEIYCISYAYDPYTYFCISIHLFIYHFYDRPTFLYEIVLSLAIWKKGSKPTSGSFFWDDKPRKK